MIKIVHTGDNHVGMKFRSRYSSEVSEQLIQERFNSLKRIVEKSNEKDAHFIVISGDLFDSTVVPQRDIKAVADILSFFKQDVIIIPGNHDFYEDEPGKLWSLFKDFSKNNIHLLTDHKPYVFAVEEKEIIFYPGICRSKHSKTNMIGWVYGEKKDPNALNVGIAHGNVEGLGLGADQYFNMTVEELKKTDLHFWLLGHIHVPYPINAEDGITYFYYCGTPAPDGFDYLRPGSCWYLEVSDGKSNKVEQWETGKLKFYSWNKELNTDIDIDQLISSIKNIEPKYSLIRINLKGRLTVLEREKLKEKIDQWRNEFLFFEVQDETYLKLQKEQVDSLYIQNSLPHLLLSKLSEKDEDELALQFAHQLIEEVKQ